MKLVKFALRREDSQPRWGILAEDGKITALEGTPFFAITPTAEYFFLDEVHLLAPEEATKIVAVGKNYADHAKEMASDVPTTPVLFLKPSTAVNHPDAPIPLYRPLTGRVDYEGELAFVISKKARRVQAADFADYILGYTCLNDVTARALQSFDGQWTRGKSLDLFAPMGPFLETEFDPSDALLETRLNGKLVQQGRTSSMLFPVPELLAFITAHMTLLPGDVVTTGTPAGIGPMADGDIVEVFIEGIGTLRNVADSREIGG